MKRTRPLSHDPALYRRATADAFRKLDPRVLARNPVMFVVGAGSLLTTAAFLHDLALNGWSARAAFGGQISLWLWATVLFANFAEALAEGRGKAQADTLRNARRDTPAFRLRDGGTTEEVSASALVPADLVVVKAGQVIPADGTVVEGAAAVDESAITGESAPVVRESGGDRSAVTGGTTVLSDRLVIRVTQEPGKSFLDRMIALVEGAERQKTPNEIALNILLAGLTIVFLLAVVTLKPFALFHGANVSVVVLIALLVCLIPTTIGGLRATWTCCCWTRPAPSPLATAWPPTSRRWMAWTARNWCTPRCWPRRATKPRRAAPSWNWPARRAARPRGTATTRTTGTRGASPSPRKPA